MTNATLSGTDSMQAVSGTATFANLSVNRVGTGYTLWATAAALDSVESGAFNITPGNPTTLGLLEPIPGSASAGDPISPSLQVAVQDALGNTVPGYPGTVGVAIAADPSGGTLSGTTSRPIPPSGVVVFNDLVIDKQGTGYTLRASLSGGGLNSAETPPIDVTAGQGTRLAFTVQPSTQQAGLTIAPAIQVTVQDAQGNTVLTSSAPITVAITAGTGAPGASLGGTTTRTAANGVATFNDLSIIRAGSAYTLTATSAALALGTSGAFDIDPGPPAQLAFRVQPRDTTAGLTIRADSGLRVAIQDAHANTVTNATQNVTVAITSGTGKAGATLSGNLTRPAVNGIATFGNLSIDSAGTAYT
ncbi:MAG: S8 family serine peptidase, partial [Acidimicrobiales bacterium]